MDKINTNLFLTNKQKEITVENIDDQTKIQFNVYDLLKTKDIIRIKKVDTNKKILNSCLEKIKQLNSLGKTDYIFAVPSLVYGFPEYNLTDCFDYIKSSLLELHFDLYEINDSTLFITWHFLELALEVLK